MSHSVQMPALGESVTEGTVTRWLKKEGDEVSEDEPLLEVSTDKVDTEVPAPYAGILEKIIVGEDETVDIGAELAIIGDGAGGGSAGSSAGDTVGDTASEASAGAPGSRDDSGPAEGGTASGQPATERAADAKQASPEASPSHQPTSGTAGEAAGTAAQSAEAGQGTEVKMPEMGESVTEGTVTHWIVTVGDEVTVDQPLVEIATDKVDAEVPSPVAGTVLKIHAEEDDTVEVGSTLALVGEAASGSGAHDDSGAGGQDQQPAESTPERTPGPGPAPEPEHAAAPETPASSAPPPAPQQDRSRPAPTGVTGGGYVTPVVRKLAADHGVDLATVSGTGVGGRIRREDVLSAAEAQRATAQAPAAESTAPPAPSSPPVAASSSAPIASAPGATSAPQQPDAAATALVGTTQQTPRVRQSIAGSMMRAVTTSAQTTTVIEVDVSRVAALRDRAAASFPDQQDARQGGGLTYLPFFVKAAVEAAKVYPIINSSISDDLSQITYHPTVDMGIAVDTPRGQVVPVIHRADDLNVGGLARHISDLAYRARRGELGPDELSGATLTVANAGSVGALFDTSIFVPPESAIVVVGAVVKRPVVATDAEAGDVIAVRSMAYVALTYDQRTIDGADAARYLATVKRRIEEGDFEGGLGL